MDSRLTFSVGYQLPDEGDERFPEVVADYRDAVSEVYFAAGDAPSARTPSADAGRFIVAGRRTQAGKLVSAARPS